MLEPTYAMTARPNLFFAGQMTGVEGYVESAGSGLVAGINAANRFLGQDPLVFPEETVLGAMSCNGNGFWEACRRSNVWKVPGKKQAAIIRYAGIRRHTLWRISGLIR